MAPFMVVLAVAVGLLIWAGMQKSKYDLSELTYIARRSDLGADLPPNAVVKSPEQVRAEHLMGVACGVIMLLATDRVFGVGLRAAVRPGRAAGTAWTSSRLKDAVRTGQGGFAVSWIAFVVGGILCGIVYLVGSVASKSKDDWVAEARQEDAWMKYAQSDAAGTTRGPAAPRPDQPNHAAHDQAPKSLWK